MTKLHTKITKEKVALVLLVLATVTNPLTNQYVIEGTVNGLIFLSREIGVYATVAAAIYMILYILINMYQTREKVNIPKKNARTQKAGKLIET